VGLWVIDLFGQEGVAINDAAVRFGMLADGDVLKVGKYRIRVKSRFAPLAPGMPAQRDRGYGWAPPSSLPRPRPQAPTPARLDASRAETFLPGPIAWTNVTASDPTPMLHAGAPDIRTWPGPEPAVLEDGELGRSVLVPLVNQFGSMQQQMLDQFQQAIGMLVQMFGTLHRDQMNVIREELDQLKELTKELHELKQELVTRSQDQPAAQPAALREVDDLLHEGGVVGHLDGPGGLVLGGGGGLVRHGGRA